ncbi:MAG: hypothetical protein ACFB2W_28000 [Leptolyngbyaceae cyanobacterium]
MDAIAQICPLLFLGELAFFSMFTTFGTPQDITLSSLRVEHLFAADAFTQAVLREHV